jgi:leucyl-tRNA synthetase
MRDMGLVKNDEPVERLFTQGMIIKGGAKMSKSLGNIVSPDDLIARYGADSTRMYTLFATSPDRELDWQDEGVEGIQRFLGRVYRLVRKHSSSVAAKVPRSVWEERVTMAGAVGLERDVQRKLFQTVGRVSDDFKGRWHFNTSIAAIMELVNELYTALEHEVAEGVTLTVERGAPLPKLDPEFSWGVFGYLALLLAPFAPHLAHELWETLSEEGSLLCAPWPKYDPTLTTSEEVEWTLQVNGKLRNVIVVPANPPEELVRERVLSDEKVKKAIAGKEVVRVITVSNRQTSNVVVRDASVTFDSGHKK